MKPQVSWAWYRPSVADALFLIIALMGLRGARHTLLDDPGLGWHIRNIDAILEQGWWLRFDPFTDPRYLPSAMYYTNQWLGDVPYWLGWRWAGLEGVAAVNAVTLALLASLLYRILLADGLPWAVALVWAALGMNGTSCSWNARPNVFSLVGILLVGRACFLIQEGRLSRGWFAGLVILLAAWANVHGGFLAGLLTLGLTFAIQVALFVGSLEQESRLRARQATLVAGALIFSCGAATLVNPYGVDLYRWTLMLLGDPFFMDLHQEWRSPDFHSGGAMRYELLLLLFPLMLGLSQRRPGAVELIVAVTWLHLALTGFRYVALWVLVAVPVMARQSVEIPYLIEITRRLGLNSAPDSLFHTATPRAPWAISVVMGLVILGGAKFIQGRLVVHKQEILATQAMDQLIALAREHWDRTGERPLLLHGYDWGGYLIWHAWPDLMNYMDDRNEVQGRRRIEEYFDVMQAKPGWEPLLAGVDLVCLPAKAPLVSQLAQRPAEWAERYRDTFGVVFERVPAQ
ncbi:MAG: hypothetical protein U0840_06165 [Gemmataceae bacterium]